MITIDEKKQNLIKRLNNSTEIYFVLESEIKEAILNNKVKMPFLKTFLEEQLNKELSLSSLKVFVAKNKKKWIKEKRETDLLKQKKTQTINNKTKGKKMKNIIAIVNFKGGVGKSTIANLINLPNKIIINLDDAQNAEELNLEDSTTNFYELKEEYGIDSLKEAIEGAFESGKENVILDTPGDIKDFIEELTMVDYFIVPFTPGDRSEKTTINTIEIIDALFEEIENRKDKWCLVLNKYVNNEQLQELDEVYNKTKKILGNRLVCKTHLKYSGVVTTIEKKRISIKNLHSISPIAYGTFKKRVREVSNDIKEMIKE